jgi:hypothetical protein
MGVMSDLGIAALKRRAKTSWGAKLLSPCRRGRYAALRQLHPSIRQEGPAEWCLAVEAATGGEITKHQLRPDLYPQDSQGAAA